MATPDLNGLTLVLRQRVRERDAARAAARKTATQHAAAEAQVAQLHGYRVDYERRWALQFRTSAQRVDLLQGYQTFCERLTQAIAQQEALLQQRTAQRDAALAALQAQEANVAAVERLIEARRREARRDADRAEQKASDEFASQRRRPALYADGPASTL